MHSFRHRHRPLVGLPALALLIVTTGCSSADDSSPVAVPSPGATVTKLCRNLDGVLPDKVDGLDRDDPEPASKLTAGWGSPEIILRCGVTRPAKMIDPEVATGDDPDAIAGEVNGVEWLMETQDDGSTVFTTASRKAYVQVTASKDRDTAGVLTDMASAIKKAIPKGIAD